MRPTSLHEQLMRAAMLTTFVAILLSAAALLTYELVTFRKAWVSDLQTQAELIAQSSTAAIEFEDPVAAYENLSVLRSQPRIQSAALYDLNGVLVASYSQTSAPLRARRSVHVPVFTPRFQGSTLEVAYPIERGSQRLGTLYLSARHDIWSKFADFAVIVLLVSTLSLATAYHLFNRLQRRITEPLQTMTKVAQEVISSHDWALRAPDTHYRDVGLLVDAFNRMLSECQTRTSELEQEMVSRQRVEQELRQADRQKDVFLATLAHELRNPLAPMTSAVALLQMTKASADTREKAVLVLDRQLKHMVRLINDLLDASRIATGKLSLHLEPLDIGQLLNTAVESAGSMAAQQGLQLTLRLPGETLCVNGDAVRLAQLFSNLLHNACRYTPHGGQVDVILFADLTDVHVAVHDTGIGVEADMQERIFELFTQADTSLERGAAGLGVGLTLSRQIVELHQGSVMMSSEGRDRGSCFTVRLPRIDCGDAVGAMTDAQQVHLRRLRILVADDNVDLADNFAELLRANGHAVEVVHDGEAALQAARTHLPDIALLDIGMPKRDGYEVARQLRQDAATEGIHLVAISGWGQATDKEAARLAGFDHHLLKPVDPAELARLLVESFEEFASSRPADLT